MGEKWQGTPIFEHQCCTMQKYTVVLLLKKNKKNSKGQYPIYLRITVDRKASFISTGHFIPEKYWDNRNEQVKEDYAFAPEINTDILQKKKEVMANFIEAGVKGQSKSSKEIKDQSVLGSRKNDLFLFADKFIQEVKNKRSDSTREIWRKHLLKLETFIGAREINFEDITAEYLSRFEDYLLNKGVVHRKDDSSNYAHAIIKTIRRFFTAAIKKGITAHYPFSEYEMPEYTPGDKDHLTLQELDKWTKFYKQTKTLKEPALYFLFGCYSGLRISDWYLFDIKKRVHANYISLRAKKNGEWITVPLYDRLKFVIDEMRKVPLTLPEPVLNRQFKKVASQAKINKHISSHCGRKTFAVTICLERGVSSETAAELMGITLDTFVKSYSKVTPAKIRNETTQAWKGL